MIRAIQRGRGTVQGPLVEGRYGEMIHHLCIRYEGGQPVMAEFGTINTHLGAVWGRLIPQGRTGRNLQKPQIAPTVGGALRAEFPAYRLENRGFGGGAVEVCPICDIAGCRHIREAGNG